MNFDDAEIAITCPGCSKQFKQKLGRLKNNPTVNCPGCHKPVKLEAREIVTATQRIEKGLRDLQRTIGKTK